MTRSHSRTAISMLDTLESRVLLSALPMAKLPGFVEARRPAITLTTLGVGGKTATSSGTTFAAPTNVTATAASATLVNLTWTPSGGANSYIIYRATGSGSYVQLAKIGAASAYADATVSGSTTYTYYVVAAKGRTLSAASNTAIVTTPAAVVVTVPDAPTALAVTGTTTNSVSLSWTDVATNESGYRVYRSTGGSYTLVANLAAGSNSYDDSGLAAATTYYYEVSAWNSAGENFSAPVSGATANVISTTDPITIYTRYAGELVLQGTTGNDSIFVSQSGSTLTIVANGYTSTANAPANGLFIYSFGGTDTITVDSSVTLKLTIASIDGNATSVSNGDANAGIWLDSTDTFSGAGVTHKVAGFYEGVSKAVGINLADPTDSGTTVRPSASMWGSGPVMGDVNQGGVGDCYFVSSLAAFANSAPAKLMNMAVDLGDGTYAVQYLRGGTATFVRVDGDLPAGYFGGYAYAHPGSSGNIWAMVMEKSYAFFRSGSNTYASLNSGWMGAVYSDFGIANTTVSLSTTDNSLYSAMNTDLASGKPVTFATYSSGTTLVSNHAYTLVSVSNIGGVNYYTVRNPWGVSGDSLEDGGGYATLTFAQMVANFQLGTAAV